MVLTQLLLLSIFLILLVILALLAFTIDHLGHFLFRREFKEINETTPHKNTIKDISRQINQHALSGSYSQIVTDICPVEAITLVTVPEMFLVVSEDRCLGYACLECLRLLFLKQLKSE